MRGKNIDRDQDLINSIRELIDGYDSFSENVGGDIYFQVNKDNKFFFSLEITYDYAEFYSAAGHCLVANYESGYKKKVLDFAKDLCKKLKS